VGKGGKIGGNWEIGKRWENRGKLGKGGKIGGNWENLIKMM